MASNKSQKHINPCSADRIETPIIWSLLPKKYHYYLKMTSNSWVCPGFGFIFGPPPKCPTQVFSNPDLTIVPYGIMVNNHTFQGILYVGVNTAMRCHMTRNVTWVDAKSHRACFNSIWLAPEFTAHSAHTTKASKQTELMTTFLNEAGKRY